MDHAANKCPLIIKPIRQLDQTVVRYLRLSRINDARRFSTKKVTGR